MEFDNGKVLVVDDDEMICKLLKEIFLKSNISVLTALNGNEALSILSNEMVDIVLTDINMPMMNGIMLLHEIKRSYMGLPVIIMTGGGTEEVAIKALQNGALNFCRKPFNINELLSVVKKGLEAKKFSDKQKSVIPFLVFNFCFHIPSEIRYIKGIIYYICEYAKQMGFPEDELTMRVKLAIDEALVNGIRHGNRLDKSKKLKVEAEITSDKLQVKVTDEGDGFDVHNIPDPKDPENINNPGGRGVLLMYYYMDDIKYNEKGNEVTLVKYSKNSMRQG